MRIPSGKVDQSIFFVAYDSSDHTTRKTGLSSFTVYRSRNGGTATVYTTPTVTELSSLNMPGLYALLVDEDTTIASGSDSEEYAVHVTATGMDPVSRTIELYRRDTTSGKTLTVDGNSRADASVGAMAAGVLTATAIAADAITDAKVASDVTIASVTGAVGSVTGNVGGNVTGSVGSISGITFPTNFASLGIGAGGHILTVDTLTTYTGNTAQTGDAYARVGAAGAGLTALGDTRIAHLDADISTRSTYAGGAVASVTGAVGSVTGLTASDVGAIKAKTDNLPVDPADASDIAGAFSTVNATLATIAGYVDTEVAAIKAKTDLIPSSPAAVGSAMTLTGAYDPAKTAATQTSADAIKAVTDHLSGMLEDSSGYRFTAHAMEEAPTGGGGSAPTAVEIRQEIDSNSTRLAAIETVTDALPSFVHTAGKLWTLDGSGNDVAPASQTQAIQNKTDNLPSDPADQSLIIAATSALGSSIASLPTTTTVNAIKAKTDNLPGSPAAVGSAMILTSAYDAAKTAASQASVDDVPTNAELATALAGADDATLAAIAALPTTSTVMAADITKVNGVTIIGNGDGVPWGPA